MNAVVVYESLWGNTAAIARAIAQGIGPGARAVSTSEAAEVLADDVDLIIAGAPLLGFTLPTDAMRASISTSEAKAPTPADLSHPAMRSLLSALPQGTGRCAAFETRIWWSPGSAAKQIARELEAHGYQLAAAPAKFKVTGRYGPLKAGELERAREWGALLAESVS